MKKTKLTIIWRKWRSNWI